MLVVKPSEECRVHPINTHTLESQCWKIVMQCVLVTVVEIERCFKVESDAS